MRQCVLGIALAVLSMSPAAAQLPAIGAPRGILRLEIGGDFGNTSDQFSDGTRQPYRAQFSTPAVGPLFFPGLTSAQSRIAELSGIGGYALSLGRTTMQAQASVGTLRLGATLGVTSKLSLFGTVPIVRQQIEIKYGIDSTGANAGINPADPVFGTPAGAATTAAFLAEFGDALDTLGLRLASGFYDATPADKALALATLASGTTFLAGLDSLFVVTGTAPSFVPLAASAAGQALSGTVSGTQATLGSLGIPTFVQPLPLPADALTPSEFAQYLTSSAGPIGATPFTNFSSFLLGNVELGASYTVLDRWNRPGRPGGLRLVARALVRLPTGTEPLPNDFVSLPTGGGQTDLQASVVADVGGGRVGARLEGAYTNQRAATAVRRVTPPAQPIPSGDRVALVREDPGNEYVLSASPYFQLAPGFAVVGVVRYWSHRADVVEYASAGDAIPGVSAGDLALDTERNATILGGGLSYAPTQNSAKVPLDAFWIYERVVSAGGGVVPKAATIRMGLRLPLRFWGAASD